VDASTACAVSEQNPIQTNWVPTTTTTFAVTAPATVTFGNVCLGNGAGLTLGFWSNRNGQGLFGGSDLARLIGLHLRNANGTDFDPGNYSQVKNWLLAATATNMAYMLSAQLATMQLNVNHSLANPAAMIYAPGTQSASSLGFASVVAVMSEADGSLASYGYTVSLSPQRTAQEALKNALDSANNNFNFVQSQPCTYTFN
jgi:hypothetical protein